ncbi:MAG: FHA domain-containing protein, partial [Blastocatellia bacterium]|nr:FHA domain-containing protein [Blastocatellia bacterium]
MPCPGCGFLTSETSKFCPHCGTQLIVGALGLKQKSPEPDSTVNQDASSATCTMKSAGVGPALDAIFVHGLRNGEKITLTTFPALIGRDPASHLCLGLQDVLASTHHARILFDGRNFVIEDRGSTNGTYFEHQAIVQKVVLDGDVIEFGPGGPQIRFEIPALKPVTIAISSSKPPPGVEKPKDLEKPKVAGPRIQPVLPPVSAAASVPVPPIRTRLRPVQPSLNNLLDCDSARGLPAGTLLPRLKPYLLVGALLWVMGLPLLIIYDILSFPAELNLATDTITRLVAPQVPKVKSLPAPARGIGKTPTSLKRVTFSVPVKKPKVLPPPEDPEKLRLQSKQPTVIETGEGNIVGSDFGVTSGTGTGAVTPSSATPTTFEVQEPPPPPPPPVVPPPGPIQISEGVARAAAKKQVRAAYPLTAIEQRMTGVVVVEILISADGKVTSTRCLSGPEVFRASALEA